MPVRLHRANLITDVFGKHRPIHSALHRFQHYGRGVVIFLRDGTAGCRCTLPPGDITATEEARTRQWREIGLGAQILRDLGISSIRIYDVGAPPLHRACRVRDRNHQGTEQPDA